MRAIVTGMIATYPVGGVVWDYGQYAIGLERLGFEVYYLEDTGWMTYDPGLRQYVEDASYGVKYLQRALAELSPTLANRWHFRAMDGETHGMSAEHFAGIAAESDLLINVSGGTLLRSEYMACPRKILIDTDPGWNHFRNYPRLDNDPSWGGGHGYRAHDFFFTYAERIGQPDCVLPSLGLAWQPTRPPVVLDMWRAKLPGDVWTTVMTWKNFAEAIEYDGVRYGTKEIEFEKVKTLPERTTVKLELASGGDPPIDELQRLGWSVVDSHSVSETPQIYRDYIGRSRGEFSVAKNVYVATRSGWFSCRSTCYLAASRPVVVQDTGFSEIIPCGEGVLAFNNLEEAVEAIRRVESDYTRHQAAARRIAEQYFASDVVLGDMLSRIGLE
jgi:hypothetical protein